MSNLLDECVALHFNVRHCVTLTAADEVKYPHKVWNNERLKLLQQVETVIRTFHVNTFVFCEEIAGLLMTYVIACLTSG